MPQRKKIPIEVKHEVLQEAGYMCGNPTCRHILTLELHHMTWVKDGGDNIALNLLALCANCHSLHTRGYIPDSAIRHWKGILHALNHAFSRQSMDLLLYLNSPDVQDIWYGADILVHFAGLIASGFAEIRGKQHAVGLRYSSVNSTSLPTTPPQTGVCMGLTEKGKQLVEAWIAGDEERYKQVLNGSHNL
jgi:hypothetical protein